MPFTVSHVAAVLPFFPCRKLDPLALVIGSMAPDFGYYLQRFDLASRAHSLSGSLAIAFPMAVIAWLAVKAGAKVIAGPLPDPDRAWLLAFLRSTPPSPAWCWVTTSLLLGIWSHTFLDSFTHASGWMVQRLSFLHDPWPLFKVLQHAGSLLGILILGVCYLVWRKKTGTGIKVWIRQYTVLACGAGISLMAALPYAWNFASRFEGSLFFRALVFRLAIGSIAIAFAAYLALGFVLWVRELKTRR
jgi:hypothetical protein